MQRSYLISLIVGAAVLVGGAIVYVVLQEPASQETQVSSQAGGTEDSATSSEATASAQGDESSSESGSETSATSDGQSQVASDASGAAETSSGSQETTGQQQASAPSTAPATETSQESASGGSNETSSQSSAPEASPPITPSFDVVRVEPSGDTVIAGRAEPGSKVTVLDNGKPLGTVTADGRGEWVFVSEKPLEPGSRELSLESEASSGLKIPSEDVVVMSVPEKKPAQGAAVQSEMAQGETAQGETAQGETAQGETAQDEAAQTEPPLAVLTPRSGGGGSQILQAPQGEGIAEGELVLEAVDYGDDGEVTISGRAAPGSSIRLYLDNELLGETMPNDQGRWSYSLAKNLPFGVYQLRADQVNDQGEVLARVETPFSRVEFARAELPAEKFVIVQPGNSLWRIARGTLGEGVRYTVIYQANQDQIGDPNLIYPGQIFMVPQTN